MLRYLDQRGVRLGDALEVSTASRSADRSRCAFGDDLHTLGGGLARAMRVELDSLARVHRLAPASALDARPSRGSRRHADGMVMRTIHAPRAQAVHALWSPLATARDMAGSVPLVLRIPVAIGLLLLAGQVAGVPGTRWATQDSWIFQAVLMSAAALCAIRAVREPRERAVWTFVALAIAGYGLGFVYWAIFQKGELDHPYPSPADGFWLSLYPFMFGALWLLARARLRGVNRRIWLDGLIVGLGLAALSASIVFREVAGTTEGDTMAIVTTLAYPVGDLLLLIMVAALFSTARRLADHTFQLLALGIGLLVITDSIWFVQVAHGTYALNGILDLGWPVAMVLIGAAAWQPRGPRGLAPSDTSITLPTILVTMCVALSIYDHFVPLEPSASCSREPRSWPPCGGWC
jgi:hypothetical protein